jgi:hypothetical protein
MSEDRDREVIITDTRDGGSNFGAIIAGLLVAAAIILGVWYLVNNTDGGGVPEEVDVTIVQE